MSRSFRTTRPDRTGDLLIRQKVEGLIEYGHAALRQFPKSERHVLAAEIRQSVQSWVAHASHAQTAGLCEQLLGSVPFARGPR